MRWRRWRILRRLRIGVAIILAAGVVGGASFLSAPGAANGDGSPVTVRWNQQWLAGGYENWADIGVRGILDTYAPTVRGWGQPNGVQSLAGIAAVSPDGAQAGETGWIVAPWLYNASSFQGASFSFGSPGTARARRL